MFTGYGVRKQIIPIEDLKVGNPRQEVGPSLLVLGPILPEKRPLCFRCHGDDHFIRNCPHPIFRQERASMFPQIKTNPQQKKSRGNK